MEKQGDTKAEAKPLGALQTGQPSSANSLPSKPRQMTASLSEGEYATIGVQADNRSAPLSMLPSESLDLITVILGIQCYNLLFLSPPSPPPQPHLASSHLITMSPCYLHHLVTSITLSPPSPCHPITLLPCHPITLSPLSPHHLITIFTSPCLCPCPHLILVLTLSFSSPLLHLHISLSISFLGHCICPSLIPHSSLISILILMYHQYPSLHLHPRS